MSVLHIKLLTTCLFSGHYKSHKQTHLCGKLEELSDNERHIYFPSSHTRPFMHLQGGPIFSISYHFVDYCYNVTFTTRNGSYELKPNGDLQCTFKIFLPYGYRVALKLRIGDNTSSGERLIIKIIVNNNNNKFLTKQTNQLIEGESLRKWESVFFALK